MRYARLRLESPLLPPLPVPAGAAVSISGALVMGAARIVPVERRSVFLEMLRMRRPFTDDDVADVVRLTLCGLVQTPTAA